MNFHARNVENALKLLYPLERRKMYPVQNAEARIYKNSFLVLA